MQTAKCAYTWVSPQKTASMPGVPVSYITPDQFKRWKEQKDLEKEQVGAATSILLTSFMICRHSATAMIMVQEKVLAERERQDDINNGKASLTGAVIAVYRRWHPCCNICLDHSYTAGRELYEKHPELFEDY